MAWVLQYGEDVDVVGNSTTGVRRSQEPGLTDVVTAVPGRDERRREGAVTWVGCRQDWVVRQRLVQLGPDG